MKYQFMQRYGSGSTVLKMCRVLGVSRSGYYSYLRRGLNKRMAENVVLFDRIKNIWELSKGVYGSPRIAIELRSRGFTYGKHRIARMMRENGMTAIIKRRFKVTTKPDPSLEVAPDLLQRDFSAQAPNEKWVADITYIWTWEGWLYLAAILDIYNREVVGWALHDRINEELVIDALRKALDKRDPEPGLIFHSDQGSQYASRNFRKILKARGILPSMSSKGDCFDNAMMESFFGTLKKEHVYRIIFHTKEEAQRNIYEYIEIFYNRKRRHSSISYMTPVEYYQQACHT